MGSYGKVGFYDPWGSEWAHEVGIRILPGILAGRELIRKYMREAKADTSFGDFHWPYSKIGQQLVALRYLKKRGGLKALSVSSNRRSNQKIQRF